MTSFKARSLITFSPSHFLNTITSSFTILIISSSLLSSHYVSQFVSSKQNKKKTFIILNMSSRRSRQSSSPSSPGSSRISDDQIIELVSKLHQFLPEIQTRRSNKVLFISPQKYITFLFFFLSISCMLRILHLLLHLHLHFNLQILFFMYHLLNK